MPAQSTSDRAATERQASVWAARLESGALTDADRRALAAWLDVHPDHRWVLGRYRELCAQLDQQLPMLADDGEVDALVARVAARNRIARWAGRALAAAAAVALAGFAWWLLPHQVETQAAERRALTLADGSRVELNAQTSLAIDLGRRERRVRLGRGEAFFQVTPDPARPFLVTAPAGTVRVTGTAFNVRQTAGGGAEVTVLEGAVQARPAGAGEAVVASLARGEQARLADARVAVRALAAEEAQNVTAWRIGQVAVESAPLGEVLERFASYLGREIAVSPEAAALRVGGRYSLDDLDGFLAAIERVLPVSVLRGDAGAVRVISRTPERR